MMLLRLQEFIHKNELIEKDDQLLLAVSGGVDSMVLTHLMLEAGYDFSIAHCNFQLRAEESNEDELFVQKFAEKQQLMFHAISFQTYKYAEENKLSIQMAARQLRYEWLHQLAEEFSYSKIITAHHLDDSVETLFINLIRGTGINGLKGIPVKSGKLIRPLLFAAKKEVEEFAEEFEVDYRTDSSNRESKYQRNYLRNQILPSFKGLSPDFIQIMSKNIERFSVANDFIEHEMQKIIQEISFQTNDDYRISIEDLKSKKHKELILFYILHDKNFHPDTIQLIAKSLESQPGLIFQSPTHILTKDREFFIVKKIETIKYSYPVEINELLEFSGKLPVKLKLMKQEGSKIIDDNAVACLDLDKLKFPLLIDLWKKGDEFMPLGMKGFKKVSDFFTDEKMNQFEKESQLIVKCGNDIVWIIGKRIDDRFKVQSNSNNTLLIILEQ